MAVSMISNQAPAESSHSFAPVEYYGLDDIMDEVGLFMDVAMMDGTTDLPKEEEEVEPSITMLAELANAVPIPVTPSPSTMDLSVSNPIAALEKSKLEAMAQHTAAAVAAASTPANKRQLIPKSPSTATKKKTVAKKKQTVKAAAPKPSPVKRSSSASVVSDDGQPKEELSEERR